MMYDSKAQGNYSLDEFHGYALSVTNNLSHENRGLKRTPIKLDPSEISVPKLPEYYMIQSPVDLAETDVYAPKLCYLQIRPFVDIDDVTLKEEAFLSFQTRQPPLHQ